jgi:glycosyltransferase involved in cell wall biosynthesis
VDDRIIEVLQSIADEEPATRRRLRALRDSPGYGAPFDTPDPLVSVVIPTYRNFEALATRSLPSALAQTHRNIEVIVVGDAAPPETAEVIERAADGRVRFENLTVRGPYSADPYRAWLIAGSPPYNTGVAVARGLWIAPLGDDDAFTPDHVERLLSAAVQHRWELAYGRLRAHMDDGSEVLLGVFPPEHGQFGLQGALYHSGLSFMEMNLADELFGYANDWSLCRRMLRAGVRMGMIDVPVVDYHPSGRGRRDVPGPEPDRELAAARERVAGLERELAVMASSRSWRLTRPLRTLAARLRGGS